MDGSELCLSCGLCCQAFIDKKITLTPNELGLAKILGLQYFAEREYFLFLLPCPLYHNDSCSVYFERRPIVCKDYQCSLLRRLIRDEISLPDSRQIIYEVKSIKKSIDNQLCFIDNSKSFRDLIYIFWEQLMWASAATRRENAALLMDIASLIYLIPKIFGGPLNKQQELR